MILEHLVVSPFGTNCFIVGCPETSVCAVLDPGDDGRGILAKVEELGLTLETVILTHGHVDHISAAGDLKAATDAAVILHEADRFLLETGREQAAMFGWFISNSVPAPDRTVDEGDEITVGTLRLKVLHTPGHSPGCISLVSDGGVFVGDLIFAGSIGRTDLPGGSTDQLLRSVEEKIFPLPDETLLYPGHGPFTNVAEERRSNPFFRGGGLFL